MANERTLTAANSAFTLQIAGLYPIPQVIKGYAADNMFSTGEVNTSELQMGVDGRLSAGYIFVQREFTFNLMADSESCDIMDNWIAAEESSREKLIANGTVVLSGTGAKFAMTRGFLGAHTPMAEAAKVLQPRKFTIVFQTISKAPN